MTTTVKVRQCHCLRCNHDWQAQSEKPPRQCPKCHSNYWDSPRATSRMAKTLPKKHYLLDGIVPPAPPTSKLPPPPRLRPAMPSPPVIEHMHRHTVYEEQPERMIRRVVDFTPPPPEPDVVPEFPTPAPEFAIAVEQGEMNADFQ